MLVDLLAPRFVTLRTAAEEWKYYAVHVGEPVFHCCRIPDFGSEFRASGLTDDGGGGEGGLTKKVP